MENITPGKWVICEQHLSYDIRTEDEYLTIAKVYEPDEDVIYEKYPDYQQAKANARLIAAAPELLEALRNLLTVWEWNGMNHKAPETLAMCKEAIKKATE